MTRICVAKHSDSLQPQWRGYALQPDRIRCVRNHKDARKKPSSSLRGAKRRGSPTPLCLNTRVTARRKAPWQSNPLAASTRASLRGAKRRGSPTPVCLNTLVIARHKAPWQSNPTLPQHPRHCEAAKRRGSPTPLCLNTLVTARRKAPWQSRLCETHKPCCFFWIAARPAGARNDESGGSEST